jgi:hypothetical protein
VRLRHHTDRAVLITQAPVSVDAEFAWRRKRYLIMMTIRVLCVIGAASTFHMSGWLAAAFVVAGMALPWTAVIMANDRLPRQGVRFARFHSQGSASSSAQTRHDPPGLAALPGDSPDSREPKPPTVIDI